MITAIYCESPHFQVALWSANLLSKNENHTAEQLEYCMRMLLNTEGGIQTVRQTPTMDRRDFLVQQSMHMFEYSKERLRCLMMKALEANFVTKDYRGRMPFASITSEGELKKNPRGEEMFQEWAK